MSHPDKGISPVGFLINNPNGHFTHHHGQPVSQNAHSKSFGLAIMLPLVLVDIAPKTSMPRNGRALNQLTVNPRWERDFVSELSDGREA